MRQSNQLIQLTLFQLRLMFRNKLAFFFNLVLPVILLMVFGGMFGGGGNTALTPIGLVDRDGGPTAQMIQQALTGSGLYKVTAGEEADLLKQIDSGTLRAVLVLPEGLSDQVKRGMKPGEVLLYWDPSSTASGAAQGGLQYMLYGLEATTRNLPPLLTVQTEEIESVSRLRVMDFMMPAMLTYMLLNAGVVAVAISLAHHRQNGTMRHLFSTPLSMSSWLAGRILANLLLSVIQLALIWVVGAGLFKVQPPSNLVGTAVILLLSAVAGMSIGLLIGSLTKSAEAAMPVALIVSMALTLLGNAMMPLDGAPEVVQNLMRLMPSFYMTDALQLVMMKGQSLTSVLGDLGVLVATSAVGLSVSAWRLRKLFVVA